MDTAIIIFFVSIPILTIISAIHGWAEGKSKAKKVEEVISQSVNNIQNAILNVKNSESQAQPWLANYISEFQYAADMETAKILGTKKHPAYKAANEVRRIALEKRELNKKCKMYEYQLGFLETMFSWLPTFEEMPPAIAALSTYDGDDEYDKVRTLLSPEEYAKLSSAQKSDLALKRWKSRKRTEWEAGRDYERYIGYKFECNGYDVEYVGALNGKEDRGIDLIAKKGNDIEIIQCKRYSAVKNKFVHENTVAQLFGVTAVYNMENPNEHAQATIYTSSELSIEAKRFANYLHIDVVENEKLKDYPIIKCNNSKGGEKIYHLPFDQQYDKIKINKKGTAMYVATAAEAEKLGYRRAYKWKGN